MRLIAIAGQQSRAKRACAHDLIAALTAQGATVTLLDNSDDLLTLDALSAAAETGAFAQVRLRGGCICCTLAARLIPTVWRVTTEYTVLVTSSLADPEVLAHTLAQVQGPRADATAVAVTSVALIDQHTQAQYPYLAHKFAQHLAHALYEPFDFRGFIHATLRLPMP
jgi:hypothetical protein